MKTFHQFLEQHNKESTINESSVDGATRKIWGMIKYAIERDNPDMLDRAIAGLEQLKRHIGKNRRVANTMADMDSTGSFYKDLERTHQPTPQSSPQQFLKSL